MPSRRAARKLAFQLLYQNDTSRCDLGDTLSQIHYWPQKKMDQQMIEYIEEAVTGTLENIQEIDDSIKGLTQNWKIERIGVAERNILRLAIWEFMYRPDIPSRVTINEAVNLAKQFCDEKSGGFVNGILDAVLQKQNTAE